MWHRVWFVWVVGSFVVVLLFAGTVGGWRASAASRREGSNPGAVVADTDPVTDRFLVHFGAFRADRLKRHALAAAVVTAAQQQDLDPDLLFALVAVESRFRPTAVSRRGARGLGQLMYPTAHAVAPQLVHQPRDLTRVRPNLTITARLLRTLLQEQDGNLPAALAAYHGGDGGASFRRGERRYVGRVCTLYASLKVQRRYQEQVSARYAEG